MKRSPDKHDLGDVQLLADLTRVDYLPQVWLAPREIRELRRLVRHRANLVRQRKDTKLRMRGLLRKIDSSVRTHALDPSLVSMAAQEAASSSPIAGSSSSWPIN